MMPKLLALDPIHKDGLDILRRHPEITLVHLPNPSERDISRHMVDAEILLLRGRHLSQEQWQSAEKLSLVTRHGVGCDNVNFELMRDMGVTVAVTADANYVSVAEHALALMLAACRNLVVADMASRSGEWGRRENLGARELRDAQVLVVGFGRIGRAFADRTRAFGADVSVYDPYLEVAADVPDDVTLALNLESGIQNADIISLHLPHTSDTQGLFNSELLSACKRGAILVNTGRGGIVDEAALIEALDAGRLSVYATDVLASEPPQCDDPLLSRHDVIITPHSAAMTAEGARHMAVGAAQNALDFLKGVLPHRMIAFEPHMSTHTKLTSSGSQVV